MRIYSLSFEAQSKLTTSNKSLNSRLFSPNSHHEIIHFGYLYSTMSELKYGKIQVTYLMLSSGNKRKQTLADFVY